MDGESPRAALARELLEEFGAMNLSIGEIVGLGDHDYGTQIVRIEAYRVRCEPSALRCLEHEQMGWFTPVEITALPLAPADKFLVTVLVSSTRP